MKRKIYLLLVPALFALPQAKAALYPVPLAEKLANANLVIEGTIESQETFWNPAHTMIFTKNHVKIAKQFKGDALSGGYADVLTYGGAVGTDFVDASDLLHLQKGERGVFCLYPNSFSLKDPATGALLYDVWASAQGFFKYDPLTGSANAPFARYGDIEGELYPLLTQDAGHTYRIVDSAFRLHSDIARRGTGLISGFSPLIVNAGAIDDPTNNLLTVNGNGFSNTPSGSAAIYFDDADDGTGGNSTGVTYNDPRIVSWTDAQIKVRVPTGAGTGTLFVTDASGTSIAANGTSLTVNYAVLSATFNFNGANYSREYNLMNTNGAGGYTIVYSNSIAGTGTDFNGSAAKATFQRALTTWKNLAGFNVVEGGTTATQIVAADVENVVQYDNTNTTVGVLPSGVLAVCYSNGTFCSFSPSTTEGYQKKGFDITVRSSASLGSAPFTNGPCPPSSSEIDLETVILHELGHAIGHGHINDGSEGATVSVMNPGKLMNYAVNYGVKRSSPDASALNGAKYLVLAGQGSHTYPPCAGTFTTEMTPLVAALDPNDKCPPVFPISSTSSYAKVDFDLSKATSNKAEDPQYTGLTGTGTGITNTVFYAVRTINTGGIIRMTVRNYTNPTTAQLACGNQGVELAVYQVNICPTGQAFPAPVATRTFTGNGTLTDITGLTGNTRYLIVMDGRDNTTASYNLSFVGSTALPVEVKSFTGNALQATNHLEWALGGLDDVSSITIERSTDGKTFTALSTFDRAHIELEGSYEDAGMLPQMATYRLKIAALNGGVSYSSMVTLRRSTNSAIYLTQSSVDAQPVLNASMQQETPVVLKVSDASGKIVWSSGVVLQRGSNALNIGIPQLASGIYLFQVTQSTGERLFTTRLLR